MRKRGRYSKEFKLEAVRLLDTGERSGSELAMLLVNEHCSTDGEINAKKKESNQLRVQADLDWVKKMK